MARYREPILSHYVIERGTALEARYVRMCLGKQKRTEASARATAERYNLTVAAGERRMEAYRCQFCGAHHTGHGTKRSITMDERVRQLKQTVMKGGNSDG